MRIVLSGLLVLVVARGAAAESARVQYEVLVGEFDTAYKSAIEAHAKAASEQERMSASLARPKPHEFAGRFFAVAEKYPEDPAALDALMWVASKCIFGPQAERALGLIARDHCRDERLKDFCGECSRYGEPFPAYEEMLRAVLRDTPHQEVKGATTLALADHLKMTKETTESRLVKFTIAGGAPLSTEEMENVQKLKARDLGAVLVESAALFQKVIDEFPNLRIENNYPQNAAELAKGELFLLRNLSIGQQAPEITGKDIHGKEMKLSEYRGKVVVLDFGSHRSCGVCRQMYPYLRSMVEKSKGKPFALLGISVDDDVKELVALAEKGEISWPIWWDGENGEGPLASKWAIRSMPMIFVLDRKGVIRNKGFIQPGEIEATVHMLLKGEVAATP